jgi:hypothetical protein
MNPELMLLITHISTEKLKSMSLVINNELSSRANLITNIEIKSIKKYILITGLANITPTHVESIVSIFDRFGECCLSKYTKDSVQIKFIDSRDQEHAYNEITSKCIAKLFRN